MSFIKKLSQLHKKKFIYFTTPSHAQAPPYKSALGKKYFEFDFSEIDDLDNLNEPEGCILELKNKLKEIYSSGFTHILTNGSTQGILALMLATLKEGDKVITAVNCHISVHNGLILTGAVPVWLYPRYNPEFGIYTDISPESVKQVISENPDAKCLIITNPTYDGVISDIEKIANICRQNNIILISDEAHGGLWNFDKTIGIPSILCGADASVQSLHKTCGGINPTALLHLSKNSKISIDKLMNSLRLISTTSPSFAAITNISETVDFLNSQKGKKNLNNLLKNIYEINSKIKKLKNVKLFSQNNDVTKILITTTNISAKEASNILYEKFKIECEVEHKNSLTFLCGAGTGRNKFKKLLKGLYYIDKVVPNTNSVIKNENIPPVRIMKMSPKQAYCSDTEFTELKNAAGKVSADILISYPPGIPIITYGEIITKDHLGFLNEDIKIRIVK